MISVCMATYNGGRYLKEQVDSILSQLSENDELIVSDDGSKDDTLSILEFYNDRRIKIFHNPGPHGCNANFENALKQAKGDYIFLADQDDVWVENKVEKCIDALHRTDLVLHDCYVSDDKLNITEHSFFEFRKSKPGIIHNLIRNGYVGACMAFKREVLAYSLPIPKSLLVYHDGWIALLVEFNGSVSFLPSQLIYFRRHSTNASPSAARSKFSRLYQLKIRLQWLFLMLHRIVTYRKSI